MIEVTKFFYEVGTLGRLRRTGYYMAGLNDPETVAQHAHRATIIAYILAKLEKANAEKTAMMCLIHDNAESRIGDRNRISARYIDFKEAEKKAFQDQTEKLPEEIQKNLKSLYEDFETQKSKEAIIAKDADLLECAITSKEHLEKGYEGMQDWINNVKKRLKTESAKKILDEVEKTPSIKWWEGLKKIIMEE